MASSVARSASPIMSSSRQRRGVVGPAGCEQGGDLAGGPVEELGVVGLGHAAEMSSRRRSRSATSRRRRRRWPRSPVEVDDDRRSPGRRTRACAGRGRRRRRAAAGAWRGARARRAQGRAGRRTWRRPRGRSPRPADSVTSGAVRWSVSRVLASVMPNDTVARAADVRDSHSATAASASTGRGRGTSIETPRASPLGADRQRRRLLPGETVDPEQLVSRTASARRRRSCRPASASGDGTTMPGAMPCSAANDRPVSWCARRRAERGDQHVAVGRGDADPGVVERRPPCRPAGRRVARPPRPSR